MSSYLPYFVPTEEDIKNLEEIDGLLPPEDFEDFEDFENFEDFEDLEEDEESVDYENENETEINFLNSQKDMWFPAHMNCSSCNGYINSCSKKHDKSAIYTPSGETKETEAKTEVPKPDSTLSQICYFDGRCTKKECQFVHPSKAGKTITVAEKSVSSSLSNSKPCKWGTKCHGFKSGKCPYEHK